MSVRLGVKTVAPTIFPPRCVDQLNFLKIKPHGLISAVLAHCAASCSASGYCSHGSWHVSLAQLREDRSGVDSKVLAQLGTALLQPKCSISSRASPWERRCGTMVNCFYLFRAPCVMPDQVRIINQGVGESIRYWTFIHQDTFGTIIFMGFMVTRIIKQGVGESTCTGHSGSVLPLGHPQHHNIIQYPWHWWSPE